MRCAYLAKRNKIYNVCWVKSGENYSCNQINYKRSSNYLPAQNSTGIAVLSQHKCPEECLLLASDVVLSGRNLQTPKLMAKSTVLRNVGTYLADFVTSDARTRRLQSWTRINFSVTSLAPAVLSLNSCPPNPSPFTRSILHKLMLVKIVPLCCRISRSISYLPPPHNNIFIVC